jgi:hypothetical protein
LITPKLRGLGGFSGRPEVKMGTLCKLAERIVSFILHPFAFGLL